MASAIEIRRLSCFVCEGVDGDVYWTCRRTGLGKVELSEVIRDRDLVDDVVCEVLGGDLGMIEKLDERRPYDECCTRRRPRR